MNAHMHQVVADVERAIHALCRGPNDFATRDKIAEFMLADSAGHAYLREKARRDGKSIEWIAGNTVDWFSAWMTRGMINTKCRYQRVKLAGKWAYRPVRGEVAADTKSPESHQKSAVDGLFELLGIKGGG